MYKCFFLLITSLLVTSCSSSGNISSAMLLGKFVGSRGGQGKVLSNYYVLELKRDNIFWLEERIQDARPSCEGTWLLSSDTLFLKCSDTEEVVETLSNSYMNQRDRYLKVINKDKLGLGNVVLKRRSE